MTNNKTKVWWRQRQSKKLKINPKILRLFYEWKKIDGNYKNERWDRQKIEQREPLTIRDYDILLSRFPKFKEIIEAERQEIDVNVLLEVGKRGRLIKKIRQQVPPIPKVKVSKDLFNKGEYKRVWQEIKLFIQQNKGLQDRIELIRKRLREKYNFPHSFLKEEEDVINGHSKWYEDILASFQREELIIWLEDKEIRKIIQDFSPPFGVDDSLSFLIIWDYILYGIIPEKKMVAPIALINPETLLPNQIAGKYMLRTYENLYNQLQENNTEKIIDTFMERNRKCRERMQTFWQSPEKERLKMVKKDWFQWMRMTKPKTHFSGVLEKMSQEQNKKQTITTEYLDMESALIREELKELRLKTNKESYEKEKKQLQRIKKRLERIWQNKSPYQLWKEGRCPSGKL